MADNRYSDQSRIEAYKQLDQALEMIKDSLETLSLHRVGERECRDENDNITLLFQDVALLKDFRQPIEQADEPTHIEDCPFPTECRKPFRTHHCPEWRIQSSHIPKGSIFEFRISLSRGAIEAPTGHEFRT